MSTITTKRAIALAVSVAAIAAAATPSFAQTRYQRMAQPRYQEPFVGQPQQGLGPHYAAPYGQSPNQCWSDEGNGRFSSCNNGSS